MELIAWRVRKFKGFHHGFCVALHATTWSHFKGFQVLPDYKTCYTSMIVFSSYTTLCIINHNWP